MDYTSLVEETYFNKAQDVLSTNIDGFYDLSHENRNKICLSVAIQQRGWTIQKEKEIWEDEDERDVYRWHMKQSRVHNYINTWYMVNEFCEKERDIILNSDFFFNSDMMLWMNSLTFSRKIDMTNNELLDYFEKFICYDFASQYNPTYKEYIEKHKKNKIDLFNSQI